VGEVKESLESPPTEEYTLEKLLEDEDLIQELRNFNPRLLKLYILFPSIPRMTKENVIRLLDYIVTEPPPDADAKRGFK
jgi:hypothetical protein